VFAAEPWPSGAAVRVRVGLHTGEPRLSDEGYLGIDVHIAARVCAAGHGGQVLLSRATAELLGPYDTVELGEHQLKGVARATEIFQLIEGHEGGPGRQSRRCA
jgi:class 3 adenylate cyclase